MFHEFFVVFRHTVTGSGLGQKQCEVGHVQVGRVHGAGVGTG